MSLWPCGKCQKQLFIWSNCSQEMWPKDNFGGDLFIQKNLDVVLFLFWSYHKSSGLSLWTVKVDGWWKGIADMDISVESKKNGPWSTETTIGYQQHSGNPAHECKELHFVPFFGGKSVCFRWLLWFLLAMLNGWRNFPIEFVVTQVLHSKDTSACANRQQLGLKEYATCLLYVGLDDFGWHSTMTRMCQNSAFSKLPKRNGARIHRNS